MWSALTWWRQLRDPHLAREVDELRREAAWYLIGAAAVGYLAWHIVRVPIDGSAAVVMEHSLRHWALFAVIMAGLVLTAQLQRRGSRLAPACLLTTSALSIVAATWLLRAPEALAFVPPLTLTAVVLVNPLAGLIAGASTLGLLAVLRAVGPLAFIEPGHISAAGLTALLTLAVAWALGRILVRAIESSTASHAEAWRHAQEARANRAELVAALKQLDLAYYRLQRANAALELAWQAADAAERAKGEFVTNISHELRTPLNLVIGFSEMILTAPESYGEPLPVAYRGDLHAIYRSAQHLLTLANDVIDLARVGMDRLGLTREPLDLGETIQDACAIVREYIETKGLALRLEIEPGLPIVQADRLRIRQVLLNLLTNAARFTQRGAITVTAARDGDWVEIAVVDTGQGIPAEQLARVFEEFYHDGGEGARPVEGLGGIGLGLPLSRRLVELHGGQIGVESPTGAGARFWLRLPVTGATPLVRAPGRPPPAVTAGGGERILVLAEPAPALHDFLGRHLRGYRVLATPDLPAARSLAAEVRALAILADAATPTDGDESTVPLLTLPLPGAGRGGAVGDAAAHLVKPVTRVALQAALQAVGGPPPAELLIVDDDRRFVGLLRRMLRAEAERRDASIRVAYSGRTALQLMRERRPDLVLLDLTLPELDGAGVLAAMRAEPALAEVPAIVISAHDLLLAEFPLRGPLSLVKPDGLGPEELLRVIDGLLGLLAPPRPK